MKNEKISREEHKMIVMDLKIDNFFAFKNFHLNMSYPKRIVNSAIKEEFLRERPNFRYKKVNILMGANATGKTSIGKMLMRIFNFIDKKHFETLTSEIRNNNQCASFSIDFIGDEYTLYRIQTTIDPRTADKYRSEDLTVKIKAVNIGINDNYEICSKRLDALMEKDEGIKRNYIEELEDVSGLSWLFEYPSATSMLYKDYIPENSSLYMKILENILKILDPSVEEIVKIAEVDNSYAIRLAGQAVIMQKGKLIDKDILSSGTSEGIEIAGVLAAIISGKYGFCYCDEKFSYIHSDIEKAILTLMIKSLNDKDQLFFTTHNMDILDLPLPKHTFTFLRKDVNNEDMPITCVSADHFLKRNTDSLRNAVENDLFSASPNIDRIYELEALLNT